MLMFISSTPTHSLSHPSSQHTNTDIPKSGGTTAKRLYQCMGKTLAHRVGADPKYGYDKSDEVVVFEPHGGKDWKVVNVDTTIRSGILRAKELGLVQSHTTDLIFTMEPNLAGQELYDEENKGRFLALFRHPVERAFSMFYYLQTASWERTYHPEWANMTALEWANLPNGEEDYMVHKLVGKGFGDKVDETDLIIAKELVRLRFIVGLMEEMNESIRRFNIVLGVDEANERSQQCMEEFGLIDHPDEDGVAPEEAAAEEPAAEEAEEQADVDADGKGEEKKVDKWAKAVDKKNSNKHPKFEEGSPEYEAVASRNRLDMLLYKFVENLFDDQKEIVDSYLLEPEVEAEVDLHPQRVSARLGEVPDMQSHLVDNTEPIQDQDSETPFFWHIPKSGGTTLQRLYWCMGSTIANEVGANPKFGAVQRDLVSFNPWNNNPGKVINVDVTSHDGILDAKDRGFLVGPDQPHVDFLSSSEFPFASMMLFSPTHKARMFALFRDPIDRAVSKFYYLQKATWEPTYNKRWARMSLEEWASRDRGDNNWMVHYLIGKSTRDALTNDDLELAKYIVRTKFVVGLMDKFDESVHRFNILLGIDESDPKNQQCIDEYASKGEDKHSARNSVKIVKKNNWNSYSHPNAEVGSDVWKSLAQIHAFDVSLYEYVVTLFEEQHLMFQDAPSVKRSGR